MYNKRLFGPHFCLALAMLLLPATLPAAPAADPAHRSDYAGQERRAIKSLSPADIDQLRSGGGWGLAKAAELNGMPGPKHILEMEKEIELSAEQKSQILVVFEAMSQAAASLGSRLVDLEEKLNREFAERKVTRVSLAGLLEEIAQVRKELRYVHLVAHLETDSLLDRRQVEEYNRLRGYHSSDPCTSVPDGHDADLWILHNGCDKPVAKSATDLRPAGS